MIEWLKREITPIRTSLYGAYVYGSVLSGEERPNDVDLALVTIDGPDGPHWDAVRTYTEHLRWRFCEAYKIKLSIMILTKSEWREIDGTVVKQRATLL